MKIYGNNICNYNHVKLKNSLTCKKIIFFLIMLILLGKYFTIVFVKKYVLLFIIIFIISIILFIILFLLYLLNYSYKKVILCFRYKIQRKFNLFTILLNHVSDNEVFEFKCSQGLLFDVSRQICDFKTNVDNCDVTSGIF